MKESIEAFTQLLESSVSGGFCRFVGFWLIIATTTTVFSSLAITAFNFLKRVK